VDPAEAKAYREKALANLRRSLELGWKWVRELRTNRGLAPLHDLPAFQALVKEWEEKRKQ
jgi:hypothetical protein